MDEAQIHKRSILKERYSVFSDLVRFIPLLLCALLCWWMCVCVCVCVYVCACEVERGTAKGKERKRGRRGGRGCESIALAIFLLTLPISCFRYDIRTFLAVSYLLRENVVDGD